MVTLVNLSKAYLLLAIVWQRPTLGVLMPSLFHSNEQELNSFNIKKDIEEKKMDVDDFLLNDQDYSISQYINRYDDLLLVQTIDDILSQLKNKGSTLKSDLLDYDQGERSYLASEIQQALFPTKQAVSNLKYPSSKPLSNFPKRGSMYFPFIVKREQPSSYLRSSAVSVDPKGVIMSRLMSQDAVKPFKYMKEGTRSGYGGNEY